MKRIVYRQYRTSSVDLRRQRIFSTAQKRLWPHGLTPIELVVELHKFSLRPIAARWREDANNADPASILTHFKFFKHTSLLVTFFNLSGSLVHKF